MMRQLISAVVGQPQIRKAIISTPGVRSLAWRFVAGENLDAGLSVVRRLNARGMKGTLNYIGTHVRDEAEALRAADMAIETLRHIGAEGLDANLSLKLTQIGLDIDESLCRTQLRRILDVARQVGNFVRIDMEESQYVEQTLQIFERMRDSVGPETVGIVLQSYLRQRRSDVERQVAAGSSIRLVKGGYWESPATVFRAKPDIDEAFGKDLELLMAKSRYPAIATHDVRFLNQARRQASEAGLPPSAFEFQLLYGVRPDLQSSLVDAGSTVRCYVPFGANWYAYLLGCIRRIPEGTLRWGRERIRSHNNIQEE